MKDNLFENIIEKYISLYKIKNGHLLYGLKNAIDLNKVLDLIALKTDVSILTNKEGELVNVYIK
jgi:hypothetical protein